MRSLLFSSGIVLSLILLLAACAAPPPPSPAPLTVEGQVTVRGNMPFAAYLLQTDARNSYVLRFPDDAPRPTTPSRLRVTGTLYQDSWNGRPYAHLRVSDWAVL